MHSAIVSLKPVKSRRRQPVEYPAIFRERENGTLILAVTPFYGVTLVPDRSGSQVGDARVSGGDGDTWETSKRFEQFNGYATLRLTSTALTRIT